jgi:hypothetical protein
VSAADASRSQASVACCAMPDVSDPRDRCGRDVRSARKNAASARESVGRVKREAYLSSVHPDRHEPSFLRDRRPGPDAYLKRRGPP